MRTILLSKSDEGYLYKCAQELSFTFGIIIGQQVEPEKYVVVHLAKNGDEEEVDVDQHEDDAKSGPKTVDDIDTQALTTQWLSALKMIPGSFELLGIFVTGIKSDITSDATFASAKKLLYNVHNLQIQSHFLKSAPDNISNNETPEYIFLAHCSTTKKTVCKTYTHGLSGGTLSSAEVRFVEKPFEWYAFECCYELDDIFPTTESGEKVNIEHQFQRTIGEVRKSLYSSDIFIQNESAPDTLTLDSYIKKKVRKLDESVEEADADDIHKVSIFLPIKCQVDANHPIKVQQFEGTIRFKGIISSRVWCNPKTTLGQVKRFVREDIIRSLAARIQVYCDGLTEPNVYTDVIFISEPPRRVYFNVPAAGDGADFSPIQFSEYIFRGESPTVAVAQAKVVLDMVINTENIVADLEDLPDDISLSDSLEAITTGPTTTAGLNLSRHMYVLGIAVAVMVLIASILLHYLFR